MGIKFDILSDMFVLNEASDFAKYFTGPSAIKTIHEVLRVSHDTKLVLVPSNNKHEMWNELQVGRAVFGIRRNKDQHIRSAKENLQKLFVSTRASTLAGKPVRHFINELISIADKEASITTVDYKSINNRFYGRLQPHKITLRLKDNPTSLTTIDFRDARDIPNPEKYERRRNVKTAMHNTSKIKTDWVPFDPKYTSISESGGVEDMIKSKYPDLIEPINELLSAMAPGDRILVKRVPDSWKQSRKEPSIEQHPYGKPDQRRYKVATPSTNEKIFGTTYTAWYFDENKLIDTEYFDAANETKNKIHIWNKLVKGWEGIDLFIIEDEKFLRTREHPFVQHPNLAGLNDKLANIQDRREAIMYPKPNASGDVETLSPEKKQQVLTQLDKEENSIKQQLARANPRQNKVAFSNILPIDKNSITLFSRSAFQKYENAIKNKIRETSEKIKQKISTDVDQQSADVGDTIAEYRKALELIKNGFNTMDGVSMFQRFMTKDTSINLQNYLVFSSASPFNTFDPHFRQPPQLPMKEWEQQSQEKVIPLINRMLLVNIPSRGRKMTVRKKNDRAKLLTIFNTSDIPITDYNQYEMFNTDKRQWMPFDPDYMADYESGSARDEHVAIAFRNNAEYTNFIRRYVRFAMHNVVREPELKEMESVFDMI